jgi:hypothetical protein
MKLTHRVAVLCLLLVAQIALAQKHPDSEVLVSIRPVKDVVMSGSVPDLRVEIRNLGDDDLLFSRQFAFQSAAPVDITLDIKDSSGNPVPGKGFAHDCFMVSNPEPLPIAVLKRWVVIPTKSSRVFTFRMDPSEFPKKPGRYSLTARYESIGLEEENWGSCVKVTPDEIAKLPVIAFRGKVKSNAVTVTVLSHNQAGNKDFTSSSNRR